MTDTDPHKHVFITESMENRENIAQIYFTNYIYI